MNGRWDIKLAWPQPALIIERTQTKGAAALVHRVIMQACHRGMINLVHLGIGHLLCVG